ncbi:DUF6777 domain-containing protein, partial [Streptomyces sp. NPDC059881]|uniref:DUF6777 domain-containing protein n=1 Tax=Streptomyces sp. NPDC059881 TaxID=3346986 RepID=UPI00365491AB
MSAGTAVVVAMAVILALTLMGGTKAGGEIFLQTASAAGRDPFTPSAATDTTGTEVPSGSDTSRIGARAVAVSGAHPGLYGGTQNVASCDVEKQITFLVQNDTKGKAFAGALDIQQPEIPSYLRSLTPARLSWDTRVTNHGYKNGAATSYQAILQSGTAVLVDNRGVPRVRCACGNPLAPAVAVKGDQKLTGEKWSSFQPANIVAVVPATKPMKTVTMFDRETKGWFERPSGDTQGKSDHRVPPPKGQPPGTSVPVLPEPSTETPEESSGEDEDEKKDEDQKKDEDEKKDEDKEKSEDEKKDEDKEKSEDEKKDEDKEKSEDEKKDE